MHQWQNEIQNKYQFRNTQLKKKKKEYETKHNMKKTNSYGYTNVMEAKWSENK